MNLLESDGVEWIKVDMANDTMGTKILGMALGYSFAFKLERSNE